MQLRDRAIFATAILLYSGPLYAGLAGHGIATIPLFALFFALWLFVVRPGDWPRFAEDWREPRVLAWPLLIFAVQLALAGFCVAIGRALGGLYDITPPVPLIFALLVSMLAIALARLLQRPDRRPPRRVPGEELGIGAGILDIGRPEMPGKSAKIELVEQVLAAVAPSDGDTTLRAALLPTVSQIEDAGVARDVLEALDAVAPRHDVLLMQTMVALRPRVAREIKGSGLIERIMSRVLESGDPKLIEASAISAVGLLIEAPDLAGEMPERWRIDAAVAIFGESEPGAVAALRRLSERVSAQPEV